MDWTNKHWSCRSWHNQTLPQSTAAGATTLLDTYHKNQYCLSGNHLPYALWPASCQCCCIASSLPVQPCIPSHVLHQSQHQPRQPTAASWHTPLTACPTYDMGPPVPPAGHNTPAWTPQHKLKVPPLPATSIRTHYHQSSSCYCCHRYHSADAPRVPVAVNLSAAQHSPCTTGTAERSSQQGQQSGVVGLAPAAQCRISIELGWRMAQD